MPLLKPKLHMRDLLILILLICALLPIGIPKILEARDAQRRAACQLKQKALAAGLIQYEQAFRAFPPAGISWYYQPWRTVEASAPDSIGPNWAAQVAGMMQEVSLAKRIMTAASSPKRRKSIDVMHFGDDAPDYMVCPAMHQPNGLHSNPLTGYSRLAKASYAACIGSDIYFHAIDDAECLVRSLYETDTVICHALMETHALRGILTARLAPGDYRTKIRKRAKSADSDLNKAIWKYFHGHGTKISEIRDGMSHTVLFSEVLPYDDTPSAAKDIRGVWVSASMGASTYSHKTTPNSSTPDNINACDPNAIGRMKCVELVPGSMKEGHTFAAARSMHCRGVNVAFADGSTRFITDDIDPAIWSAIATRDGGADEISTSKFIGTN